MGATLSRAPLCICIGVLSAEKMGHEVARTEYLLAAIRLVPASHLCLPYSGCMRRNCFPKPTSLFGEMATARLSVTPYFFVAPQPSKKRKKGEAAAAEAAPALPKLRVESYHPPDPGPYPQNLPPQNAVRFTPVQVEAIKSGVQPGLTMVVGPPGALLSVGGASLLLVGVWGVVVDLCQLQSLDKAVLLGVAFLVGSILSVMLLQK